MAKLPPKPLNPVHEFFPVGTDGQSPLNSPADFDGAFTTGQTLGRIGKDEDDTKFDTAFPDIPGCPKGMERNAKGECVAIKESPSWAKTVKDGKKKDKIGQNDVYDTPHDKIETPVLAMQAGKAKKKDDTPKKMPAKIGKWFSDYKKRWANHPSNQQ